MEKSLFGLVLLLCVSATVAFWELNRLPDLVKNVVKNESPKKIFKNIWNSHQAENVEAGMDKAEARFLKNILRFGTLRRPSSPVGDEGHATNCGPANHNFSLTWTPKEPDTSSSVKLAFNMMAPTTLPDGTVDVIAYMDGTPLVEQKFDVCTLLLKIGLKCPIAKGQKISLSYTVTDISMLPATTYTVVGKVWDKKSNLFMCANATITIRS